jgi:hypothetical protein
MTLTKLGLVQRGPDGTYRTTRVGGLLAQSKDPAYRGRLLRQALVGSPDFSIYWSALVRSRSRFGQSDLAEILVARFGLKAGYSGVYAGYVMSFAKAAGLCRREGTGRKYVATTPIDEPRQRSLVEPTVAPGPSSGQTTLLDDEVQRRTVEITNQLRGLSRLWNIILLYLTAEDETETERYREQALALMERVPLGPAPQGREAHHEMGRSVLQWSRRRLIAELEARDKKSLRSTLQLMEEVLNQLEVAEREKAR